MRLTHVVPSREDASDVDVVITGEDGSHSREGVERVLLSRDRLPQLHARVNIVQVERMLVEGS